MDTSKLKPGTKVRLRVSASQTRVCRVVKVELPFLVWLDDGLPGAVHPDRLDVIEESLELF